MHQDHVTGRCNILNHLERYPVDFFDTFVKPRDPCFRIAGGAQIPEVRMPFEGFTELCTLLVARANQMRFISGHGVAPTTRD